MKSVLVSKINQSTAHRKSRVYLSNYIIRHEDLLDEFITIAFDIHNENHVKAFWSLELVCEKKLKLFVPYLDSFCEVLPKLKNDSAIRPATKICMFLAKSNHRKNGIDRTHVRGSFPVETLLGEQNVGRSFFQDYSEAITSGVLGDLPAIYIGNLAAKVGNTWAGQFEIRFTMHIRFSELNYPSLGSARIRKPLPPPSKKKFKSLNRDGDMQYESYDGYEDERSQTSWDEQPKLQRALREPQNRSNSEIREKDGTAGALTFVKVARR